MVWFLLNEEFGEVVFNDTCAGWPAFTGGSLPLGQARRLFVPHNLRSLPAPSTKVCRDCFCPAEYTGTKTRSALRNASFTVSPSAYGKNTIELCSGRPWSFCPNLNSINHNGMAYWCRGTASRAQFDDKIEELFDSSDTARRVPTDIGKIEDGASGCGLQGWSLVTTYSFLIF